MWYAPRAQRHGNCKRWTKNIKVKIKWAKIFFKKIVCWVVPFFSLLLLFLGFVLEFLFGLQFLAYITLSERYRYCGFVSNIFFLIYLFISRSTFFFRCMITINTHIHECLSLCCIFHPNNPKMSSRFSRYGFTNVTITLFLWARRAHIAQKKNGNNSTNNKTRQPMVLVWHYEYDRPFQSWAEKYGIGLSFAAYRLYVWFSLLVCTRSYGRGFS